VTRQLLELARLARSVDAGTHRNHFLSAICRSWSPTIATAS